MICRKIDKEISDFYREHNKALLLTGARQVGKTYAFRKFGRENFENVIEINFVENRSAIGFLDGSAGAKEMILRISALTEGKMVPGRTLIFFDEVQEYPEIVTLIKFLVDEGSYRYALSGSLLGVELKDLRSEPVGYMDVMDMYPLDFEEFALAVGVSQSIIDSLSASFADRTPVDPIVHDRMMKVFRLYLVVGGMPAAVAKYIESNNLRLVEEEQKAILKLYRKDIAKYDPDDKLYLNEIFDLIPSELNAQNKRFILKKLNENFKFSRYYNSFLWLKNAGVAIPVYNVEEPQYPLKLSEQRNLFKLFQNDVGLLACQYSAGLQLKLLQGEVNLNYGGIFENAAAQELTAHGFSLAYYNNKKLGELDFVVTYEDKVLPLEIKSGKDYSRHSALDNVLKVQNYHIERAVVFCNDNVSTDGAVTYLPIYMLMFLKTGRQEDIIYRLDLDGISR
jgi:predicted AAA+ superfamily ATPase